MSDREPIRERRAAARRDPQRGVEVSCLLGALGLGHDLAAVLLDVSEDGACLTVREPLATGDEVRLSFRAPGWDDQIAVTATVVGVEDPVHRGAPHRVRVRFERPLRKPDLLELGRALRG